MSTIATLCSQLFLGILLMAGLIWALKKTRSFQAIYDLSPQSHQSKKNTVSFGGIGIVVILIILQLQTGSIDPKAFWVTASILCFAIIGFMDDFLAKIQKQNRGFTPKQKFFTQCFCATSLLLIWHLGIAPLQPWQWPAFIFLIVGSSNATNLTDGLDGLLGGLSLLSLFGFCLYFYNLHTHSLMTLSLNLSIGIASFLVFNLKPAKIFMGDTGSLAIGAGLAALAIAANNPLMLLPLGGVYIIETLSVIIQVISFKYRKKRVFLMSPLHHHFELMGLSERQTVTLFWVLGALFTGLFLWQN